MRYWLLLFFTAISSIYNTTAAQNHQFTIVSDNDGYTSINNDGYYTNGVSFNYQWRKTKDAKKNISRANDFEIGQNIYTARFSGEFYEENLDRPITGYLYGKFQQTLYNSKERMLRWGIDAGFVGANAFGQEVQNTAHKIMRIYKPTFWDRQLKSAFGLNAGFSWSPQVTTNNQSKWDLKPVLTATAGTFFTNAGTGAALLFGRFNKNSTSSFWNNHKGDGKPGREFFAYLWPMMYIKAYDATVQGGMFNKEAEKIPGKLNPYFFQTKLGVMYAGNRLAFGATAIYESKQSLTQVLPQYYGRLQVSWMW